MNIWTVQSLSQGQSLLKGEGQAHPDFETTWLDEPRLHWGFQRAYEWMGEAMERKGLIKPPRAHYPFWGWAYVCKDNPGDDPAEPDWAQLSEQLQEPEMALQLEVPESSLLLSHFELWHSVLGCSPLFKSELESHEWDKAHPEALKGMNHLDLKDCQWHYEHSNPTWDLIFDLHFNADLNGWTLNPHTGWDPDWVGDLNSPQTVQATFWTIDPAWIKQVRVIQPTATGLKKRTFEP